MLIKIGDFEYSEVWDGVFYKKLSNYPQVSDWEIKTIIDIVNITLHNSLKNFEDIGHWNKYPRSVAKWIFIPMRRTGR